MKDKLIDGVFYYYRRENDKQHKLYCIFFENDEDLDIWLESQENILEYDYNEGEGRLSEVGKEIIIEEHE